MNTGTSRYVINVVTRDQVGIIANVSDALFRLGGNLEALSQTVVWGWFTMIVCGEFPRRVSAKEIKEAVESSGDYRAIVLPHDGLREGKPLEGEPFIVTVKGEDKPGIVRRLTRCFSQRGINIDDVWFEVREGQFIVIFHVTIPAAVDPGEVRHELENAAKELNVSLMVRHQDIFVATNSLSVHTRPEQG
ncbi:MAG TPA: ACT domain-containing protein [Candidatus Hydrogenedentes bacterium]|nr:ACT domain-containing protein [Candidatus Hydrogenedentota bacterium]HQM48054.1 ACT domain-containing protein [Candidatus Hydrogenedentota bacterium]